MEGRKAGLHPVRAALSHLALHARDVARRERYVAQSEDKLAERAQELAERMVELEQREADIADRLRACERREKEAARPIDRDLAGFSLPASLKF